MDDRCINIGDWVAYCCECDLHQIKDEDDRKEALYFNPFLGVWKTKEEALDYIKINTDYLEV